MPRLGTDDNDDDETRPLVNRRARATAYATAGGGNRSLSQTVISFLMFAAFFVMARNMLTNDYREDARQYLKVAGKTEEEIDTFVGKTAAERRQAMEKKKEEAMQLKDKVAALEKQVDRLLWKVYGTNETKISDEK